MIIIYYRDKDGNITYCHDNLGQTMEELEVLMVEYNRCNEEKGKTVYAHEAEAGSLEAYLFQKLHEKREHDKDELQYVIDRLEEALDAVRGLK